jgi:Protein of unknown function (DUF1549)/Protein of unknown function (DUF1553)
MKPPHINSLLNFDGCGRSYEPLANIHRPVYTGRSPERLSTWKPRSRLRDLPQGYMLAAVLCALVMSLVIPSAIGQTSGSDSTTPLHEAIDSHIAQGLGARNLTPAELCSDAEFLRRLSIDLTGWIPSSANARAFLDDPNPDKRAALVDRLLASPEFARHMARVFDVTLMERRPDKHVPSPQWREFLRTSFASNKHWDQIVREILEADGTDANLRPAAKFYLDRDGEPNLITKDISRLFLGMNLQCAQCHDHPLVGDYEQDHYYGIFAFLNRSYVFTDKEKKATYAEKADGDVTYKSVFDKNQVQKRTGPKILDGPALDEPKFEKGQEYQVVPADGVRPVPKFSRRAQLASQLVNPEHIEFARNIANRLWAMVMGRGLVEPLDMHHSDNPPSHPELLQRLTEEIGGNEFDIRSFLRELVLSETYQRSSELPAGVDSLPPDSFAVAKLKPLTAEQLAWSLMQATGLADAERKALGDKLTESTLHDKLVGQVQPFVRTFAVPGQPQQEFQATIDQALFLANGSVVRGWLVPRSGNLLDQLLAKPSDVADELYLAILTRRPSEEERRAIDNYLHDRQGSRPDALQELAWALLASAEFRFNH